MKVKIVKEAVQYYCTVTGAEWHTFYDNIDDILRGNIKEQTGVDFLKHLLLNTILKNDTTLDELKSNKDAVKKEFDNEGRKESGEFFTPLLWAAEARKYFDKYIPNWASEYTVWEGSCGIGNLVREASIDRLYMSTLQQDDVNNLKSMKEFENAYVFQLDFLNGIDYDVYNTEFVDKLPEELQDVIRNDKPLIFFMNPPYKSGMANMTDVGRYMKDISTPDCDISKAAYDLFYQFCWRVMNIVETFHLTNCYYGVFGPLTWFTGANANILLTEFEHHFEFVDGMCISANEFSDTSESINWGIGFTLWKSGEYTSRKDILLEKKMTDIEGNIVTEGRVLYELTREKLSAWVQPTDVSFYTELPIMTSHLTFKGGKVNEKVGYKGGKIAVNALGTLMVGNTLTRADSQSAVLSTPTTIQYTDITEENFWRCVASFVFRQIYDANWAVTKKEISAPNVNVEGYQEWLYNALVLFLFEYKAMNSSIRGVSFNGDVIDIHNHLFPISAEEVNMNCSDPVILKDMKENPCNNEFIIKCIEKAKPYWNEHIKALYDWCKNYILNSYDRRKAVNYVGSLDCWDAGLPQVRASLFSESDTETMSKLLVNARDSINKDLERFGFVSDVMD